MISLEQRATIRRYFFHEHWKVGTIASQLGLHPDTVRTAIDAHSFANTVVRLAHSQLDPFKPFLLETLEQFPTLRATRMLDMIRARGYAGSYDIVRAWVRTQRPRRRHHEAFFALRTLPAEQAQVDWGHFGRVVIGHAHRPLSCFVMTLSWSRAIYARFYLDQRLESFLDGHVRAFDAFGGAPREILYDNLKSVVLDRQGQHIHFQPKLLEFSSHYGYLAKPCAPYRGNEKGKVERTIRYLRDRFFGARSYRNVDDLNQQLLDWIDRIAAERKVPGDPAETLVRDALLSERVLLRHANERFDTDHVRPVHSGKTPYVRFDTNDYSIPHTHVGRPLTLVASATQVRLLDGATLLATHPRCWDRLQPIEIPAHLDALADVKRHAAHARGRSRLTIACPSAELFFAALVARARPLQIASRALGQLLDVYGPAALERALAVAVTRDAIDPSAVEHLLLQHTAGAPPAPLPIQLPDNARHVALPPSSLEPFAKYTRNPKVADHDQ